MKTLYIECNMGAAGDMLTGALLELLPEPRHFIDTMNVAGIPGLRMSFTKKSSRGILGTHMAVEIRGEEELCPDVPESVPEPGNDHSIHEKSSMDSDIEYAEHGHAHAHPHIDAGRSDGHVDDITHDEAAHIHAHHHTSLTEVCDIIDGLKLPEEVRGEAKAVYALLAEAEAHAHGSDAASLHFHEVGMLDAITDVCAVCLLMRELAPERVVVSPIHTGFGQVRCAHGIMPVPTPATAYLLRGIPASAGSIRGELLTPTGAALLVHFADEFGWMPPMRVEKLGCGIGTKEFAAANCVRAFLGEETGGGYKSGGTEDRASGTAEAHADSAGTSAVSAGSETDGAASATVTDEVWELNCNLDDMSGEAVGFAMEELISAGALDVYFTPVQMKKGRPGVKLSCLCRPDDRRGLEADMLRLTSTLGVRAQRFERVTLPRWTREVDTPYGVIRVKRARGDGFSRAKPEYDDVARAARQADVPLSQVLRAVEEQLMADSQVHRA